MNRTLIQGMALGLSLATSAALADTYNDYVLEQVARIGKAQATVEDLFGNPRLIALAENGDVRAQYELGMLKYSFDDASGVEWLEKAAAQGHVRAQYILSGIYTEGKIVPRDLKRAFKHVEACSNHGDAECTFYLGMFYEEGLGAVKANPALAKWYLQESAGQGVKRAIEHLCKGQPTCEYKAR